MKCPWCGTKSQKVHKDTYNCQECGEFSEQDVKAESGQKSKEKVKFTGNTRR